jgi:SEL1 protein
LKSDVGKALLLYSRMADLGYEVAQSNAAWILDRYGDQSICMGESGFCTDMERHPRAHALWWQASEQGNEHAALLIGDAYYYGRVCISSVDLQNYISLVTICGKMLEALCDFICITFT